MPNRPMTATRKLTPRNSSDEPKVMRNWPDTVSMPMPASNRPSDIEMTVLCLASRPRPTKEQKVSRYTAKNSGGPNFSANDEIIGARNVISMHRDQRADEGRGEGRGQRFRRPALLRHRIAVEGGRDRPGLAGDVEQDRGDGAAEQRAPIDAGQHHDGRGRIHREGQRQQDRDAVGAAEARQHADEDAEHEPDHHQQQRLPRQQHGKAVHQKAEASIRHPNFVIARSVCAAIRSMLVACSSQ